MPSLSLVLKLKNHLHKVPPTKGSLAISKFIAIFSKNFSYDLGFIFIFFATNMSNIQQLLYCTKSKHYKIILVHPYSFKALE